MPNNFEFWKKQHDSDLLEKFNNSQEGLLWLKIKSITRKSIITDFTEKYGYTLNETAIGKQFKELYKILSPNLDKSHTELDKFIFSKNIEQLDELDTEYLVNELYQLKHFDWGGDYQNALDKYLVKRYVKENQSYDWLKSKIDTDIHQAVQGYVLCSWYNHWSSILIEHIFKSHKIILPTIGQIKNVDFFLNGIPFDLKVTYLPTNFIKTQRKNAGLKPELTFLKQRARELNIQFDNKESDSNLYYQLTEKMKDKGNNLGLNTLKEIKDFRLDLIKKIKTNPLLIAKNLYEEQGEMRFGAENRIFLILIDKSDFDNSWKLKRNIELLKPKIYDYLDSFSKKKIDDFKLNFYKKGNPSQFPKEYKVLTDVLVIEKELLKFKK